MLFDKLEDIISEYVYSGYAPKNLIHMLTAICLDLKVQFIRQDSRNELPKINGFIENID